MRCPFVYKCIGSDSRIPAHQIQNKRTIKDSFFCYKVNMERKEPMDFSSYFYFEASGDSEEADSDDYPPIMGRYDCDDDALSSNGSGSCNVDELDEDVSCDEEHDGEEVEKKEDDEDEKSGVCGMSCCEDDDDDDEIQEEQMKSYVSFDSGRESMDEMEKNRLFWEACLAS